MGLTVLLVDDIRENISALIDSIANPEIEFVPAGSGADALAVLAQGNEIDLALIDVQMPDMDGFELATLMRGVERTKNIPIIFVTAQPYSSFFEFKGYQSGAIDFIFKPVNIQMLKSKIDVFHRLKVKRLTLKGKIEELELAKTRLEESEKRAISADLLKSAFLANMSHEIRTPITSVIGFAELLRPLVQRDTKAAGHVDAILRNGKHLVELINGILDLSKIEANQLELELSEIEVGDMVRDVLALLAPLAKRNRVTLNLERGRTVHSRTDKLRVRQILTNVIGNAIKFSPGGDVQVVLRSSENDHKIGIEVRDTGVGISPNELTQLFKPFSQIRTNANSQGTGLGLSLSKQLANLLGGDVFLKESSAGGGSTFVIEIPVITGPTATPSESNGEENEAISSEALADVKVLLADDSPDNRALVEAALTEYGARVHSVENGRKVLDQIADHGPDVLLLDYKMPVLDGLRTTQALRAAGHLTPIILLTANAMRGEKEAALSAGASDYVSKPIDWLELIKKIRFHVRGGRKPPE